MKRKLCRFRTWPRDPVKRLVMARLDLDFVEALERCGINTVERAKLRRTVSEAAIQMFSAQAEMGQRRKR